MTQTKLFLSYSALVCLAVLPGNWDIRLGSLSALICRSGWGLKPEILLNQSYTANSARVLFRPLAEFGISTPSIVGIQRPFGDQAIRMMWSPDTSNLNMKQLYQVTFCLITLTRQLTLKQQLNTKFLLHKMSRSIHVHLLINYDEHGDAVPCVNCYKITYWRILYLKEKGLFMLQLYKTMHQFDHNDHSKCLTWIVFGFGYCNCKGGSQYNHKECKLFKAVHRTGRWKSIYTRKFGSAFREVNTTIVLVKI